MLQTSELSIQNLQDVFSTFNQVSTDLQKSYEELQGQVANLNLELATARSARLKDLKAKEQMANKLSSLMKALPGGILVINSKQIVVEENQSAIDLLGVSLINLPWNAIHKTSASLDDAPGISGEFTLGNNRSISVTSSDYGDQGDKILLITDVTETVALNRQINRDKRLRAMGEMAARLAHQIRTPLSTAILYLSNLNTRKEETPESGHYIHKIHGKLGHIEKLVTGMLQYINEGINTTETLSLNQLVQDITGTISDRLKDSDSHITYQGFENDAVMRGNPMALENAILNLVENALAAIPAQAVIRIGLDKIDKQFVLTIEDNGPGIAPELREQIFDPFFSTKNQGTGLGLAIVLSVIKAHGGDIQISDSSLGGAKFLVHLPDNQNQELDNTGLWESQTESLGSRLKEAADE